VIASKGLTEWLLIELSETFHSERFTIRPADAVVSEIKERAHFHFACTIPCINGFDQESFKKEKS
jgi:hypothetical protein